LAEVIRRRRESSGWSLNRLAELTQLSRQMISLIETARKGILACVFVFSRQL
jgi:transcriptional regulator with XRE-family HTH domain